MINLNHTEYLFSTPPAVTKTLLWEVFFIGLNEDVIKNSDLIFTALPHGVSEEFVLQAVKEDKKVVDLGADFRLKDEATFKEWYNVSFIDKKLHEEAVYGLCEHYKDEIKNAKVIANPGCYVTSISLPLMPLLKEKLIKILFLLYFFNTIF